LAANIPDAKGALVAFREFLMAPLVGIVLLNDLAHTLV
jgi:hypothetical protein